MHTQTGKSPWVNLSDDNICLARYTKWGEAYAAKEEKKKYIANVDLSKCNFEIKIADFGFSKKLR